ncbi:hypothetical protein AURDEDRAFT_154879 [Auricularia subglabra TFB-10046 SS5]|uniref:Uncharacterized protein n=1 Tax=Auricularia subglabra (strain TFB-10046 / SS5) TaxID=717982 RepID=J0WT38_AURST|nr:hypothetical protein AURDEDRAFT_154879 [Auricularia subglabra TFB-10046 SS5]
MRRSWSAVRRFGADAVVFLGDMLDDGRFVRTDEEYTAYAQRFKHTFPLPTRTQPYYVVGNRDVGLGDSAAFSAVARQRFSSSSAFGQPPNHAARVGNHTLVFLDAPGLVEEDYRRFSAEADFDDWPGAKGGAIEFVKHFSPKEREERVVLFSHIPLARPDAASCGPLRERPGGIRRGVGRGYQNLVGKQTTSFVLRHLRPVLVLSADDTDYCQIVHRGEDAGGAEVREVSVKAFALTRNIRRPGFQLLALSSKDGARDRPCFMPDTRALYWRFYLPLVFLALGTSLWIAYVRPSGTSNATSRSRTAVPPPLWSAASSTFDAGASPPHTPLNLASFRAHSRPGTPLMHSSILLPQDDGPVGLGLTLHPPASGADMMSPVSPLADVEDAASFLPAPGTRRVAAAPVRRVSQVERRVRPVLGRVWRALGVLGAGSGGGKRGELTLSEKTSTGRGARPRWWRVLWSTLWPALALWLALALLTAW